METRVSASCSTFALKPRCHCPNPFCFLLLDLFTAAQGLSWRWPAHFWALGFASSPSNTVWYLTHFPPGSLASFLLLLFPVYRIDSGLAFQASFWFLCFSLYLPWSPTEWSSPTRAVLFLPICLLFSAPAAPSLLQDVYCGDFLWTS